MCGAIEKWTLSGFGVPVAALVDKRTPVSRGDVSVFSGGSTQPRRPGWIRPREAARRLLSNDKKKAAHAPDEHEGTGAVLRPWIVKSAFYCNLTSPWDAMMSMQTALKVCVCVCVCVCVMSPKVAYVTMCLCVFTCTLYICDDQYFETNQSNTKNAKYSPAKHLYRRVYSHFGQLQNFSNKRFECIWAGRGITTGAFFVKGKNGRSVVVERKGPMRSWFGIRSSM